VQTKKGFTLIELLAVIVILGLLMALAIPSITRYINQSRMKTLVTSIDGFIGAASVAVNDNDLGSMSDGNKIFYIPVNNKKDDSCVSLEKGGNDPFGEYVEAYVVVYYNAAEYKYDYYFTFIDSAGYGMKLTKSDEIKSNGKGQIVNPSPINPSTSASNTITSQTINGATPYILGTDSCNAKQSTPVVISGGGGSNPSTNPSTPAGTFKVSIKLNICNINTKEYTVPSSNMKFSTWVNSSGNTEGWTIDSQNRVVYYAFDGFYSLDGVTGNSTITLDNTYTTTMHDVNLPQVSCGQNPWDRP
jgi:prepilin-type N-terminal cleavage/methylation domain-containing protein